MLFSATVLDADSTTDTGVDIASDTYPTLLVHCVSESSSPVSPGHTSSVLQRNCLLTASKSDNDMLPRVGGVLLKRSATDDNCPVAHKRHTTHSSLIDTSVTPVTSSTAHNTTFPVATLPSFPPTLFSCFPSLGNSRTPTCSSPCVQPPAASRLSTPSATVTSTLFSIPVHGLANGPRPLLIVPSLNNCVLIPSLCSTPLLCVLNAAAQSQNTSALTTVTASV